ncbi:MAG: aminotransferase class I/II-fold pyridoxal phosphate-dependent enzyme [Deltaproteobacteria bacterium]|nr:aminotransferase class I/II-fold pyridoxal phosphate-dependent enzyme [Deltaproteobacteria bacterium]
MIDLRSDTITKPTSGMRKAMYEAEVGDAVFGEDPTVNALEEQTAELLGKEAAVYMPSGTMTNQVALRTHTEPGDEIIIEEQGHIYYYEGGAPSALSGVMCRLVKGERGIFSANAVSEMLRLEDVHFPRTKLICLENTHNRGGGSIWPMSCIEKIAALAKENHLSMHLDGARLWNASAATGIPERDYARYFDSVSVCFSKGLGAPVGSALTGSAEFIKRARRFMKQFGGYMRQAGIIAAGALYALEHHRKRLFEDHDNVKILAEGLAGIPDIDIEVPTVETNILLFSHREMNSVDFMFKAHAAGVLILPADQNALRAVTSMAVDRKDILKAVGLIEAALKR